MTFLWSLVMDVLQGNKALREEMSELKALMIENIEISKRIEQQVTPQEQASNIAVHLGTPRDKP